MRDKDQQNKERYTATMDPELLERIDSVCRARGESRSNFLERIVRAEIDGEEKRVKAMESPAMMAVASAIMEMPGVLETLSTVVREKMTKEDLEAMREEFRKQKGLGKERRGKKRANKKGKQ